MLKEEFEEVCTDEAMRSKAKFYNLASWDHDEESGWEFGMSRNDNEVEDGDNNEAEDGDEEKDVRNDETDDEEGGEWERLGPWRQRQGRGLDTRR